MLLCAVPIDSMRRHIPDFFPRSIMYDMDGILCSFNYIILEFVPLFIVFIACHIGQRESYKLPLRIKLLYIPTTCMTVIALTNPIHGLIFSYDADGIFIQHFCYYIVVGWCLIEALIFFVIMYKKTRVPNRGRRILFALLAITPALLMGLIFLIDPKLSSMLAQYESYVFCIVMISAIELLIDMGIIPNNTHYRELFECSGIDVLIGDENYNMILASDFDSSISENVLRSAEREPVLLKDGRQISSAPISCGYVVWAEDVSELKERADELADANEYLEGQNQVLVESYKIKRYRSQLEEKNRLYHEVQKQTEQKKKYLEELIDSFSKTLDEETERKILSRISLVGVYLKRRSNLFFLSQEQQDLSSTELENGMREMIQNLEVYGYQCVYHIEQEFFLPFSKMSSLLDAIEEIVEKTMDQAEHYYITIEKEKNNILLNTLVSSMNEKPDFDERGMITSQEENKIYRIVYTVS